MKTLYIITGASGHLGSTLVQKLKCTNEDIRIFCLPNEEVQDEKIECIKGNICNPKDVERLFENLAHRELIVIHCAGYISIASKPNPLVEAINVGGTQNMVNCALKAKVKKFIYVASVHALTEKPDHQCMDESDPIDVHLVHGAYAISKAKAVTVVENAMSQGLRASIVFPSGLCGPNDTKMGKMNGLILRYQCHKLPFITPGGYDFVDVRDVADAILTCANLDKAKARYILSNRRIDVKEIFTTLEKEFHFTQLPWMIPYPLLRPLAWLIEGVDSLLNRPPLLTPYALKTLQSNSNFSHQRAQRDLNFNPRSFEESLHDQVLYLQTNHRTL